MGAASDEDNRLQETFNVEKYVEEKSPKLRHLLEGSNFFNALHCLSLCPFPLSLLLSFHGCFLPLGCRQKHPVSVRGEEMHSDKSDTLAAFLRRSEHERESLASSQSGSRGNFVTV